MESDEDCTEDADADANARAWRSEIASLRSALQAAEKGKAEAEARWRAYLAADCDAPAVDGIHCSKCAGLSVARTKAIEAATARIAALEGGLSAAASYIERHAQCSNPDLLAAVRSLLRADVLSSSLFDVQAIASAFAALDTIGLPTSDAEIERWKAARAKLRYLLRAESAEAKCGTCGGIGVIVTGDYPHERRQAPCPACAPAPAPEPVCGTCGDRKTITAGGFIAAGIDYKTIPCPACSGAQKSKGE